MNKGLEITRIIKDIIERGSKLISEDELKNPVEILLDENVINFLKENGIFDLGTLFEKLKKNEIPLSHQIFSTFIEEINEFLNEKEFILEAEKSSYIETSLQRDLFFKNFNEIFNKKFFSLPVDNLQFSTRARNFFIRENIFNVAELINILSHLKEKRNIGKITILGIHKILLNTARTYRLNFIEDGNVKNLSLKELTEKILSALDNKRIDILKKRYGIGCPKMTLSRVGEIYSLTRERIRQLEGKAVIFLRSEKNKKNIKSWLMENFYYELKKSFNNFGGIFSIEDIISYSGELKLILDILELNFEDILNEFFLTENKKIWFLDKSVLENFKFVTDLLQEIIREDEAPSPVKEIVNKAMEKIKDSEKEIVPLFIERCIAYDDKIKSDGKWCWKGRENPFHFRVLIIDAMRNIGGPAHFSEIGKFIKEKWGGEVSLTDRSIHSTCMRFNDFVYVSPGTYALSCHGFKRVKWIKDILLDILKNVGRPMQKQELIRMVLEEKPFVSPVSVEMCLSSNKEIFKPFGINLYGLTEWKYEDFLTPDEILNLMKKSGLQKRQVFQKYGLKHSKDAISIVVGEIMRPMRIGEIISAIKERFDGLNVSPSSAYVILNTEPDFKRYAVGLYGLSKWRGEKWLEKFIQREGKYLQKRRL